MYMTYRIFVHMGKLESQRGKREDPPKEVWQNGRENAVHWSFLT